MQCYLTFGLLTLSRRERTLECLSPLLMLTNKNAQLQLLCDSTPAASLSWFIRHTTSWINFLTLCNFFAVCFGYATGSAKPVVFPAATLRCRVVDRLLFNLGFILTIPKLPTAVITSDNGLILHSILC